MSLNFEDCCLEFKKIDGSVYELFGYRNVWKKFRYLHSLFRLQTPDSIVCEKPNFYMKYCINIPFEENVVTSLLTFGLIDPKCLVEYVQAHIFFDTDDALLKEHILNALTHLVTDSAYFIKFLLQANQCGLELQIIYSLIGRYYSVFNAKQLQQLTALIPEKKYDISLHNTIQNNILLVYSTQPDVIHQNLKIHVYTSSAFIDGDHTSGFWVTCRDKDDSEYPSYEECKVANTKPQVEVLLKFEIFDASFNQPSNHSIKNGYRGNKKCLFPNLYDYTTLARYGVIIYSQLHDPEFICMIQF